MLTQCIPEAMRLTRLDRRDVITSDAEALLLGDADKAIGLVERFAACFSDGRAAGRVVHDLPILISQRVPAIALG